MYIKSPLLLIAALFVFLSACTEQQSISTSEVKTYEPVEGAIYTKNIVDFDWQAVANANFYTLLVSNAETNEIIIDTSMYSRSYKLYLNPGTYLWQVQAVNSISATASEMRTLIVNPDWVDSMAWDETIEVVSPADSVSVYANSNITIDWRSVGNVNYYNIKVVAPSFENPITEVYSESTYSSATSVEFGLDTALLALPSALQWQVWATKSINVNGIWREVYSPAIQRTLFAVEE
ncbi:MAG: hypothetical protein ABJ004_17470 [Cyclobacteriaceae bacterium]